MAEIVLKYNPVQAKFMEARRERLPNGKRRYKRMCLVAGRQGGKSLISCVAGVEEGSVPGSVGCMFAPTYPMLHDTIIPTYRSLWPETWCYKGSWDKAWSESHLELVTSVDSIIRFRSLDNPDRSRGMKNDWLSIDEACMLPRVAWATAEPTLAIKEGVGWICTTPRGFDWVYEDFWKPAVEGEAGYWAARYKTIDNPAIAADTIARAKKRMDATFFQQEYEADFVNFTGAIYGNLLGPRVLTNTDEIKQAFPEWPNVDHRRAAVIGMDPGADHPFAASLLLASDIGWVIAGEYRERNAPLVDHVKGVQGLALKYGPREIRYVVDRSAKQIQIELAQYGIYASGSESHVESGIMRIQSWLRDGKLWILESAAPKTLDEYRTYRWAATDSKLGEVGKPRPFKEKDDLCDSSRYAAMSCFEPEPLIVPATQGRQLKDVPREHQWAFAREQRISKGREENNWLPETAQGYPMGDFYE